MIRRAFLQAIGVSALASGPIAASVEKKTAHEVRTNASTGYFNMAAWDACCNPDLRISDFRGSRCWIYVDIPLQPGITTKVYVFTRGGIYFVFGQHHLPEEAVMRDNPNRILYLDWARERRLMLIPASVIDSDFIEQGSIEDCGQFDVQCIGFDPWSKGMLPRRVSVGGSLSVAVPMTAENYSKPMLNLKGAILQKRLRHPTDPVLDWMLGNVEARVDGQGRVFPRKARQDSRIGGAVALIAAMGLARLDWPEA